MRIFDQSEQITPPGIHFRDSDYVACRYDGEDYSFSSFSSEDGLREFMEYFEEDLVGVRVNTDAQEMEKALTAYFEDSSAVTRGRSDEIYASVYGEEIAPLTFQGEETQSYDELFQNTESKAFQEVT